MVSYDIYKDEFNNIYNKFINLNINNLDEINDFFEEYSKYRSRNIFNNIILDNNITVDVLDKKIFDLLYTFNNDLYIGDNLIKKYILIKENINYILYLWDINRVFRDLDLDIININIIYRDNISKCNNNYYKDNSLNIYLVNNNYNDYMDGNIINLINIRHIIKHYYQLLKHYNKSDLEGLYYKFSYNLINYTNKKNIKIYDTLNDFIPIEYDSDLYAYNEVNKLLNSFDDTRLNNYVDEVNGLAINRDVYNDSYYEYLKSLKYKDLADNYFNYYNANEVDNCSLEENGYDKANLLPFIYTIIDYIYYGLINKDILFNWNNISILYDSIIISKRILKEFNDYNILLKEAKDNNLISFTTFKLYDIYNDASDVVLKWSKLNHIDKFEYNTDYYSGTLGSKDMQRELNIMYLEELIKRKM